LTNKNDLLGRRSDHSGDRVLRQDVTLRVQDDGPVGLDGLGVVFDDERVASDGGIALIATLAQRLGVEALAQQLVGLRGDRTGAANAVAK